MKLDALKPLVKLLPEVRKPARAPPLNEKLMWTVVALILFFVMYHIYPIGVAVPQSATGNFFELISRGDIVGALSALFGIGGLDFAQMIMASKMGSLITTGIGPIILASIFLQLFIGAKIIDIDMRDPEQKAVYQGTQKLLALALCFFEAAMYTLFIFASGGSGIALHVLFGSLILTEILVIFQLAFGSIILMYADEIVSKYGIGSGISLFIAAGVSLAVIQGAIGLFLTRAIPALSTGAADSIPKALLAMLPLLFTGLVFFASSYAEGMKIEIPLSFERARGFGGRFPIKFLYVSNIPVILASALMINMQLMTRMLSGIISTSWVLGGVGLLDFIARMDSTGRVYGGLIYFITPSFPNPAIVGYDTYMSVLGGSTELLVPWLGSMLVPEWVHIITYVLFMVILCVIFGRFWIETTGMGPKDVAEQLQRSGMQLPGYRRDPRIVERVLGKYIPTITILGSIFVGLLAAFADLTGALGTGTGILLTVGILYRMYEDLSTQRMFEMYPSLKSLVG
ncbi:MAG: preprotein translocase subunit SecY [Candidatus Micrarchaeota archaeon]